MSLPDPLPIQPFTRPLRGAVELPGSKSITNRALLLAALCDGPVTLTGALFSDDTRIMAEALRKLGFRVAESSEERIVWVEGQRGSIPRHRATLDVGLAGTAARFLTALCAAAQGRYDLDGVPQMRQRPMKGLIDTLRSAGAKIDCPGEEGFFPLKIQSEGLDFAQGIEVDAAASSQILSALLLVAPLGVSDVLIRFGEQTRQPFVDMTIRMMSAFGAMVSRVDATTIKILKVPGTPYRLPDAPEPAESKTYAIEPDATAASYFLALPRVVPGALQINGFRTDQRSLQGDVRFWDVLRQLGVEIADAVGRIIPNPPGTGTNAGGANGGLGTSLRAASPRQASRPTLNPALAVRYDAKPASPVEKMNEFSFREFSDTFLTLAAIAPLLAAPIRLTGLTHTRKQETDRVAGMARELTKLGQKVIETEDSLEIHPQPLPMAGSPIEIDTYGDHRFAMSFGILGCHDLHGDGRPWLAVRDPGCCAKTFPNFFELLESLRQKSLDATL